MSSKKKALAVGMGSVLVLAGASQGAVALATPSADVAAGAAIEQQGGIINFAQKKVAEVQGEFAFTQAEVSSNEWLYKNIGQASQTLCGSQVVATNEAADAQDWVLTVDGAVADGYSATIDELANTSTVKTMLLGCACAGNPADGASAGNALVKGIPATLLIDMANPADGVNTVVFTSADGYQVALPLKYLDSHYCPLVFNVNGAALAESVGGTNQLWLGGTPASYFARDIVSITLEQREVAPASPTSDEALDEFGANLPNVGVLFGGEVR